ncbi:MAG TPA: hypothetical protein VGH20_07235 [Myxococcales bacterium]|jgi:hypothetical protein
MDDDPTDDSRMAACTLISGRAQPEVTGVDVLKQHGAGLYGCMIAVAGDRSAARAAYAAVCRRLPAELLRYRGRSSLRSWFYGLGLRELRDTGKHTQTLRDKPARLQIEPLYPVGVRGTVAAVRARLDPQDLELLVLRVDRGFDWRELAYAELGQEVSELAVAAQIRTLRARLHGIRARIERTMARSRLNFNR